MAYAIQHARSLPGSDCLPTQAQFVLDFVNDVRAFGDTPWSEWKKRWRFYGKQIPDWWLREIQDRTREDLPAHQGWHSGPVPTPVAPEPVETIVPAPGPPDPTLPDFHGAHELTIGPQWRLICRTAARGSTQDAVSHLCTPPSRRAYALESDAF